MPRTIIRSAAWFLSGSVFLAHFAVQHTGNSHENGEQARAGQITNGFGYTKSRFCKCRRTIVHRCFGCAGTNHQQNHHPYQWQTEQSANRQTFAIFHQTLYRTSEKTERHLPTVTSAQSKVRYFQFSMPNTAKKRGT